jgi:hypothetical protein
VIRVEEAAKTAGGGGDCRRVGKGLVGEDGQQRVRCLDQGGGAGARVGPGQCLHGGGELAAGAGVTPGAGVHQEGGDCHAEFTTVGGPPGAVGVRVRGLSVRRACGDAGPGLRWAPKRALACDRSLDRGKISRCWLMPVTDKTLATSGDGAASRKDPPGSPARRPLLTRTASPLASAYATADRSMMSRLAAGRSRLRSCSRRAGADAMSSSPLSAATT